jgi:hypothetical protein
MELVDALRSKDDRSKLCYPLLVEFLRTADALPSDKHGDTSESKGDALKSREAGPERRLVLPETLTKSLKSKIQSGLLGFSCATAPRRFTGFSSLSFDAAAVQAGRVKSALEPFAASDSAGKGTVSRKDFLAALRTFRVRLLLSHV